MLKRINSYLVVGISALAVFALPLVTLASDTGLQNLVRQAGGLIQGLIPIVIGLAVLVFLWGVLQYVIRTDDGGKETGRTFMLWGIIALFVMVSVWGLVNILDETLSLDNATPSAPGIPRSVGR